MAQLGVREREAIRRARQATADEAGAKPNNGEIYVEARRLQAEALARMTARAIGAAARLARRAAAPLVRWRHRRATIAALNRLDEAQLRDVGVLRGDIAPLAAELARRAVPPAPRGSGPLAGWRQTHVRRASMAELRRLDDRTLADIGLRREQLGAVIDGLVRVDGSPRRAPRGRMLRRADAALVLPLRRWVQERGMRAPQRGARTPDAPAFGRGDHATALDYGALETKRANCEPRRHVA